MTVTHTDTPTGTPAARSWFALRFHPQAPTGLPPFFEADHLFTYTDSEDTWITAIWQHSPTEPGLCILRLPKWQVVSATRHPDLGSAASHAYS